MEMAAEDAEHIAENDALLRSYYALWLRSNTPGTTAADPSLSPRPAPTTARTLLVLSTVGKSASDIKLKVMQDRIEVESSAGLSLWKAALGAASLGTSMLVTGMTGGRGGSLKVPIGLVEGAFVAKGAILYSTLRVIVGGESADFSMTTSGAQLAAEAINAAIEGGVAAEQFARAWEASRQRDRPSGSAATKELRRRFKGGLLTPEQFESALAFEHRINMMKIF